MCSSSTSCSFNNVHQKKSFLLERRPTMLKDFLDENSNSCSSSGFKSFPRKPELDCIARNNPNPNTTITSKLQRSRSKAASTTLSALHSFMNAVKNIPFTAVKNPSILPRSLSRRLSKRSSSRSLNKQSGRQNQVQIAVKVKDILRWTSFSGEKLPQSLPWDFASCSPHHHFTTATTITGSTTTTTTTICSSSSSSGRSSSNGSSWCDSDFTEEFLPSSWGSENESKKYSPCVGNETMEGEEEPARCSGLEPKFEVSDEDEQYIPISVLDFQFGEDDGEAFLTIFEQSIANVERTKEMLVQKLNHFEDLGKLDHVNFESWSSQEKDINFFGEEEDREIEVRAMELLNHVKETTTIPESCDANMGDNLLLDFFQDEMGARRNYKVDDELTRELISKAKAWISGKDNECLEWGLDHKKEACVRDMHKGGKWINKFEDEREELALEIESAVLEYLVDELSLDLFTSK